jgi:hypothetical protein
MIVDELEEEEEEEEEEKEEEGKKTITTSTFLPLYLRFGSHEMNKADRMPHPSPQRYFQTTLKKT